VGILNRISILFQSKALHIVDEAEDPRETLEYAYERQRELLAGVRQALVEVGTSKHQLSAQAQRLKATMAQLEEQARRGVAAGREDLARLALERRQLAEHQLQDIEQQLAEVRSESERRRQLLVDERVQHQRTERSRNAYKGELTKVRKTIHAGKCPWCRRSFKRLEAHMAAKHPDVDPEAEPS